MEASRRLVGIPSSICHKLLCVSDNSAGGIPLPLRAAPAPRGEDPREHDPNDSGANSTGLPGTSQLFEMLYAPSLDRETLLSVFAASASETLAAAAAGICNTVQPRRALLLLQQGSSLRSLQLYMRQKGLKVCANH